MGSGAENIYTLPPPVVLPLGEAPARGEGEPQDRDPGPDLAPSRQPGGLPAPPALGSGAGRRVREGRGGSKTRRVGRRRGERSCSAPRGASTPRLGVGMGPRAGTGRTGPGWAGPGAASRPPRSAGGCLPREREERSQGGKTSRFPAWDARSREWGDGEGSGARSEQGKGKKTTHPHHPPPLIWMDMLNKAQRNTSVCSKYFNKDSFRHRYTYKRSYIAVII